MEKEDCALPITIPDRASTHYVQRTQNKQTKEGGKGAEEETEKKKKGLPGDPPAWNTNAFWKTDLFLSPQEKLASFRVTFFNILRKINVTPIIWSFN